MEVFLKKEFEDAGYSIKVFYDHVLSVEDFLKAEELDTILNIIKTTANEEWSIEYTKNLARFCMEKFGRDDVDNLVAEGKFEITQGWDDREESDYPQELRDAWAAEMKETRANQEIERAEWQELLKQGWKLDADGNKYKVDDLQ